MFIIIYLNIQKKSENSCLSLLKSSKKVSKAVKLNIDMTTSNGNQHNTKKIHNYNFYSNSYINLTLSVPRLLFQANKPNLPKNLDSQQIPSIKLIYLNQLMNYPKCLIIYHNRPINITKEESQLLNVYNSFYNAIKYPLNCLEAVPMESLSKIVISIQPSISLSFNGPKCYPKPKESEQLLKEYNKCSYLIHASNRSN